MKRPHEKVSAVMKKHPRLHSFRSLVPVSCLFLAFAVTSASAQTTWINPDLVNGGAWGIGANWSTGSQPTSSADTIIDNGGRVTVEASPNPIRVLKIGMTTTGNRLTVAGATLTTRAVTLGEAVGSSGFLTIGDGGILQTNQAGTASYSAFHLGPLGTGTLQVDAGGKLYTGGDTRIAYSAGGAGFATVRGLWQAASNMSVGVGGTGRLDIGSGGVVTVLDGAGLGVLTVGGNNTTTSQGTLVIGGASAAEGAGTLNAASIATRATGVVRFNHIEERYRFATDAAHGAQSIVISGTGRVHVDAGTTILDAANTYTGGTTVTGGTLLVNEAEGGSATGSGALFVESGGTLGGTGEVAGMATIEGALIPGDELGILSFGSGLTLAAGSETFITIQGAERGSAYTAVDVAGVLTFGGTLNLSFSENFVMEAGESYLFQIFSAGSFAGGFETVLFPSTWNGQTLLWDRTALYTDGTVSVSTIPEPEGLALGAAGIFLFLAQLRRRIIG